MPSWYKLYARYTTCWYSEVYVDITPQLYGPRSGYITYSTVGDISGIYLAPPNHALYITYNGLTASQHFAPNYLHVPTPLANIYSVATTA